MRNKRNLEALSSTFATNTDLTSLLIRPLKGDSLHV